MNKTFKRSLIIGCLGLGVLGLGGCSAVNNFKHDTFNNNNYNYHAQPQKLTANQTMKTFSIDYYDASSNHSADQMLDRNVNTYLNSIKNLNEYDWDVKPTSVGDDNSNKEDQVMTDQVILKRKNPKPVNN